MFSVVSDLGAAMFCLYAMQEMVVAGASRSLPEHIRKEINFFYMTTIAIFVY